MNETLRKKEILRSKKTIQEVLEKGKKYLFKDLTFFVLKENDKSGDLIKIAFAVSKRKVKLAVKRNKVKRVLREVYRKNKKELFDFAEKNKTALKIFLIAGGTNQNKKEILYEDSFKCFLEAILNNDK